MGGNRRANADITSNKPPIVQGGVAQNDGVMSSVFLFGVLNKIKKYLTKINAERMIIT